MSFLSSDWFLWITFKSFPFQISLQMCKSLILQTLLKVAVSSKVYTSLFFYCSRQINKDLVIGESTASIIQHDFLCNKDNKAGSLKILIDTLYVWCIVMGAWEVKLK